MDVYVDIDAGDDANSGLSAGDAVQSLSRGTDIASTFPTGTIHLADGIYAAPGERFPLLVPSGFTLEGESRDNTIIRFTGESRTIEGTTTEYYGGTAILSGDPIRRLTLEGLPIPSRTCLNTYGIGADRVGLELENVRICSMTDDEQGSFGDAVWSVFGGVCRRLMCQRSGPVSLWGRAGATIVDSQFENTTLNAGGPGSIRNCWFLGYAYLNVGNVSAAGDMRVSDNGFLVDRGGIQASGNVRVTDNRIEVSHGHAGIFCGGRCEITNNVVISRRPHYPRSLFIEGDGSPIVRGNHFENDGYEVLRVWRGATPRIENNTFVRMNTPSNPGPGQPGITIEDANPDLGGGREGSAGNNDFSRYQARIVVTLSTGGTVFARNNTWRLGTIGISGDGTARWASIFASPDTAIDIRGARWA